MGMDSRKVEYLVADTTAFIQNAPLQDIAEKVVTCQEVVNEITDKRQLRRLVVLPYDLIIKSVFPENIKLVTEFSKKTGDYPSLSATDIKVMALTYQLEKELVGTDHLRTEPIMRKEVNLYVKSKEVEEHPNVVGFHLPATDDVEQTEEEETNDENGVDREETVEAETNDELVDKNGVDRKETVEAETNDELVDKNNVDREETVEAPTSSELVENNTEETQSDFEQALDAELNEKFGTLQVNVSDDEENYDDVLTPVKDNEEEKTELDEDDNKGWITPSNVKAAKQRMSSHLVEEKNVKVACITTDFAMQNVLKQMNLNVSALDGRIIKQLRTYILRCYACFKTTSVMTKKFCPKCGNNTLKRVSVTVDESGKYNIHINAKHPLTARGKKFSLPRIQGGKHPNNPILVEDQPMPDQKPSRLARTKNNPLNDDYVAGFSPFIMRDVNSKSAMLCIRPGGEMKHWMRKNPNESHRRRRK